MAATKNFLGGTRKHTMVERLQLRLTLFCLEIVSQVVDDSLVKIITTKMGVSGRRQDLKHTIANLENTKNSCEQRLRYTTQG